MDRLSRGPTVASNVALENALSEHQTYLGPTTEYEPVLMKLGAKHDQSQNSQHLRTHGQATFLLDPAGAAKGSDVNAAGVRHRLGELERTIKPYVARIAAAYQNFVHDAFPVLDDPMVARLQSGSMIGCDALVVAAMTLVAIPWYTKQADNPAISDFEHRKLEGLTFGLFQQSLYQPTLNTVQAGLLLMQCPQVDSKALNTQLAEITFELGLHLDCSEWNIEESVQGLRRRLAWGVFVQDKWCSVIHGRPSAISSNNWSVRPLTEHDWSPHQVLPEAMDNKDRRQRLFIELINLTKHLYTILNLFYSVLAMQRIKEKGSMGLRSVLETAKDVQIRIKNWYAELPASLRVEGSSASASSSPSRSPASSASFLRLAYHTTEITLHRSIIRNQPASPLEEAQLTSIVRMAAKERLISAMDFANRLRPHQLAGFWLFPSKVCFAIIGSFGALLGATSPAEEECLFYKARMREYRWTLGMAVKDADWLRYACQTVEEQMAALDMMDKKTSAKDLAEQLKKLQAEEVQITGQRPLPSQDFGHIGDEVIEEEEEEDDDDDDDEEEEEDEEGEEMEEDDGEGDDVGDEGGEDMGDLG